METGSCWIFPHNANEQKIEKLDHTLQNSESVTYKFCKGTVLPSAGAKMFAVLCEMRFRKS